MLRLLALACFALLTLAGCAQIPPYPEVPEPNSAKLRLRMEEPIAANVFLVAVDAEKCETTGAFGWLTGGVDSLYQQHRVSMLDQKPPREGVLQYRVPAGKPITSRVGFQTAKLSAGQLALAMFVPVAGQAIVQNAQPASCAAAPAFVPQAGEEYEIAYTANPSQCQMVIYRLSADPSGSIKRTNITHDSKLVVSGTTAKEYKCEAPQPPTPAAPTPAR